jgi:hypothetical protein
VILWVAPLSLPAGFAAGRDFPVDAFRATPVEVFTAVVLRAVVVPAAGLPGVVLPDLVVGDVIVPVVELLDEDFPDAAAALPAEAWPEVFFATAALPADWRAPDFTAGIAGAVLPAFALVPVGAVAPVDFADLPAPLPRDAAFFPVPVAAVAGLCGDFSLPGALTVARAVAPLAALPAVLPVAVLTVFPAAGLLAPVVLPAAFRGLVVAMRFSRRSPLRCMLQRRLR